MKKLTIAAAALLMLTACGSSSKTGKAEKEIDNHGSAETVTVEVTTDGDKVTAININETYHGKKDTKKDLKEAYDMKKASPIGKEWYEQIDFLEKYIVENGLDAVELGEDGKPVAGSDLAAGCTINLADIMETANKAADAAK